MRVWFGGVSIEERDALLGRSGSIAPRETFPFSAKIGSPVRRTLFFDRLRGFLTISSNVAIG